MSPSDKPSIQLVMDLGLSARVDDFRFGNNFPSRAAAIRWLLAWALDKKPDPTQEETGLAEARCAYCGRRLAR